jgi:hypothetical protein
MSMKNLKISKDVIKIAQEAFQIFRADHANAES